jgi:hypothetical protein
LGASIHDCIEAPVELLPIICPVVGPPVAGTHYAYRVPAAAGHGGGAGGGGAAAPAAAAAGEAPTPLTADTVGTHGVWHATLGAALSREERAVSEHSDDAAVDAAAAAAPVSDTAVHVSVAAPPH